jgi:hypothetical protein
MVRCPCGSDIARFAPADDHGSVMVQCPACKQLVEVHNGALIDAGENDRSSIVGIPGDQDREHPPEELEEEE